MFLKPSEIRFSQDSIGNSFGGYTSHPFRRIGQTLDDILSGRCNVDSIPRISVMNRNGLWFTADNRRLWVFQQAEKRGKIEKILRVCDVLHQISIRLRPKIMEYPCVLEETQGVIFGKEYHLKINEWRFSHSKPTKPFLKASLFFNISYTENACRPERFGYGKWHQIKGKYCQIKNSFIVFWKMETTEGYISKRSIQTKR